VLRKEEMDR
jgi:hypothetical protein